MEGREMNIGVVIVTYNRVEKLSKALEVFDAQSKKPSYIIIVDNASTDRTSEVLAEWEKMKADYEKKVVRMLQNEGGSGGFYTGLELSLQLDADWIWVSDDDAYPEEDALEKVQCFLEEHRGQWKNISAVCGQVINNGKIDYEHRRSLYAKGLLIREYIPDESMYKQKSFLINTFSYVGTIINREKLKEAGLPRKEYFIWFDDTEHGLRMGKMGKIICVPDIKIHHDVGEAKKEPDWRWYYRYRNMSDCYKRNFPKRCYTFFCLKAKIKVIFYQFFKLEKLDRDMLRDGITDAEAGRFGLHDVYRPGRMKNVNKLS